MNRLALAYNRFVDALKFGYDATENKGKRKPPSGVLQSEDSEMKVVERRKYVSAARDVHRNFALAGWMIRRHLDYVSTFHFRAKTGKKKLDARIEELVGWWSRPENFDITGRHSLARYIRLQEARRSLDGDGFTIKLQDGLVQAVEGDRVRTPDRGLPKQLDEIKNQLIHGVLCNESGRPLSYCVCKRGMASDYNPQSITFEFERMVSAANMLHFAYFDRFDQVRGISPFVAAINTLRDTYEGFDYALAKLKVSQLFGLAFYRESEESIGVVSEDDDSTEDGPRYKIDFNKGPALLDLDPGDRAEFLESKSPSLEFQQFTQSMISVALKSLDIPYSFYAENYTNYSGARQALLQYELSAEIKRKDVLDLLNKLTEWRLRMFMDDGYLPNGTGYSDLAWEWVPRGIPWIDPLKEILATKEALGAGLTSRTRALKEASGDDFFEIADELAAERDYLEKLGLPVDIATDNASIAAISGTANGN